MNEDRTPTGVRPLLLSAAAQRLIKSYYRFHPLEGIRHFRQLRTQQRLLSRQYFEIGRRSES